MDESLCKQAYILSKTAHGNQKRHSGDPYFSHPLAVAEILVELKLDQNSIVTALLHDVAEDTEITLEEIEKDFGEEISKLVDGVTKQEFVYGEARPTHAGAVKDAEQLAQKYGQPPKEGMLIPTNGRVFSIDIPSNKNTHNHPDNVGGRYFGPNTGTIEIFYRQSDVATQIRLLRNSHGRVSIEDFTLYEIVHTKTGYTLYRHRGENLEPDIESLKGLLQKADEILTGKSAPYFESSSISPEERERTRRLRRDIAMDLGEVHSKKLKEEKEKKKKSPR